MLCGKLPEQHFDGYGKFQIEHLGRIPGVRNIKTEIPLQKIKHSSQAPI